MRRHNKKNASTISISIFTFYLKDVLCALTFNYSISDGGFARSTTQVLYSNFFNLINQKSEQGCNTSIFFDLVLTYTSSFSN
jgi:hypothetical protein